MNRTNIWAIGFFFVTSQGVASEIFDLPCLPKLVLKTGKACAHAVMKNGTEGFRTKQQLLIETQQLLLRLAPLFNDVHRDPESCNDYESRLFLRLVYDKDPTELTGLQAQFETIQKRLSQINEVELQLLNRDPMGTLWVMMQAQVAEKETASRFTATEGLEAKFDGRGDAFRHLFWNLLSCRYGNLETCRAFAIAHEPVADRGKIASQMDFWNNGLGQKTSSEYSCASKSELIPVVFRLINSGKAKVIFTESPSQRRLVPSNYLLKSPLK